MFVFFVVPHALGAKLLTGEYVERDVGGSIGLKLLVHGGVAGEVAGQDAAHTHCADANLLDLRSGIERGVKMSL